VQVMSLGICLYLDSGKDRGFGLFTSMQSLKHGRLRSYVLSHPTEDKRCCGGVDSCNLSNIDDFRLDVALSPLSFPASSAMMWCVNDRLSLHCLEIFTSGDGM